MTISLYIPTDSDLEFLFPYTVTKICCHLFCFVLDNNYSDYG